MAVSNVDHKMKNMTGILSHYVTEGGLSETPASLLSYLEFF